MMEKLIFSKRLLEKAEQLRRSSVSVLEAPAGYGKTTAVTWALEGAETALWYTGVENLPDTSFYWFVRQMAAVDERTVRRIETLGFLNRSNAPLAAQALLELRVSRPMTLIFDNFQFATDNWPPQIIDALVKRPADGLHIIFIAQNLGRLRAVFEALEGAVCFLRAGDLLLAQEDVCAFARRRGGTLTAAQAGPSSAVPAAGRRQWRSVWRRTAPPARWTSCCTACFGCVWTPDSGRRCCG